MATLLALLLLAGASAELVALYDLDGSAADASGLGHDGTAQGNGWATFCSACDAQAADYALHTADGAWLELPSAAALADGDEWSLVFSLYHSTRTTSSKQVLYGEFDSGDADVYRNLVFIDVDGCVYVDQQPNEGVSSASGATCLPLQEWVTLAVVRTAAGEFELFLGDGSSSSQALEAFQGDAGALDVVGVGYGGDGFQSFEGYLNSVFVYSSALNDDAVANLDAAIWTPLDTVCCPSVETAQTGEYVLVTLSTTSADSYIVYTTDGSTPACGDEAAAADSFTTTTDVELQAIACSTVGAADSEVTTADVRGSYVVATPTFATDGDSDSGVSSLEVTVATTTSSATLWVQEGSAPACGSGTELGADGVYTLTTNAQLFAIGCKDGYGDSDVAESGAYYVQASQPRFIASAYESGATVVSVYSTTAGVTIRATLGDGSQASPSCDDGDGDLVDGDITLTANAHLKAIACRSDMLDSWVSISAEFTVQAYTPTFVVDEDQVTITTASPGCRIYWTTSLDAEDAPSCEDAVGTLLDGSSGTVTLGESAFVYAVACGDDNTESEVGESAAVTVVAADPQLFVASEPSATQFSVYMSTATVAAVLRYASDGTTPSCSDSTSGETASYSATVTIDQADTLRVIACGPHVSDSGVAVSAFLDNEVEPPTFSDGEIVFGDYFTVHVTTATADAGTHIRYYAVSDTEAVVSCADPDTGSLIDASSGDVVLYETAYIVAVACHSGWASSAVVTSGDYFVGASDPLLWVTSVADGAVTVQLQAASSETTARYTLNSDADPHCDPASGSTAEFDAAVELSLEPGDRLAVLACHSLVSSPLTVWQAFHATGVWVDIAAEPQSQLRTPLYNYTTAFMGAIDLVFLDDLDDWSLSMLPAAGLRCSVDGADGAIGDDDVTEVVLAVSCLEDDSDDGQAAAAQIITDISLTLQDEDSSVASGLGAFFAYACMASFFVYRWRKARSGDGGHGGGDGGADGGEAFTRLEDIEAGSLSPSALGYGGMNRDPERALHEAFDIMSVGHSDHIDVPAVMWLHMVMGVASTVQACHAVLQRMYLTVSDSVDTAAHASDSKLLVDRRQFMAFWADAPKSKTKAEWAMRAMFIEAGLLSMERKHLLRHLFHFIDRNGEGAVLRPVLELELLRFGRAVGPGFTQHKAAGLVDKLGYGPAFTMSSFVALFSQLADVRDDCAFNERLDVYLMEQNLHCGFLEDEYTVRSGHLRRAFELMDSAAGGGVHYGLAPVEQLMLLGRFMGLAFSGFGGSEPYLTLNGFLAFCTEHMRDVSTADLIAAIAGYRRVQALPMSRQQVLLEVFTALDADGTGAVLQSEAEAFVDNDLASAVPGEAGPGLTREAFLAFAALRCEHLDDETLQERLRSWQRDREPTTTQQQQRWHDPTDFSLEILGQAAAITASRNELLRQAFATADESHSGVLEVADVAQFGRFMTARWTEAEVAQNFGGRGLVRFPEFERFCLAELSHLNDARFASLVLGFLEGIQLDERIFAAFGHVFARLDVDQDGLVEADEMFNFCRYVTTHNQLQLAVNERPFLAKITLEEFVAFCATYTKIMEVEALGEAITRFVEYAF